jgi:acyl transferase domain-containing protein/acyl carrier protein
MIGGMKLEAPRIPIMSNLTGEWLKAEEAVSAEYWGRHLRETVQFGRGVEQLLKEKEQVLIEVGPGQSLSSVIRLHPEYQGQGGERLVVPTLRNEFDAQPDQTFFLNALAKCWVAGVEVDWATPFAEDPQNLISIPSWLFEPQRYWLETSVGNLKNLETTHRRTCYFRPSWQLTNPTTTCAVQMSANHGTALLLGDGGSLTSSLRGQLEASGFEIVTVNSGEEFRWVSENECECRAGRVEDYIQLFEELKAAGTDVTEVVYLYSTQTTGDQESVLKNTFYNLMHLIQSFPPAMRGRLRVVTAGAFQINADDILLPLAATAAGPCKAIRYEYPNWQCQLIDLAVGDLNLDSIAVARRLAAVIASPIERETIGLRGPQSFTPSFYTESADATDSNGITLRDGGVYVITGGIGGIGRALAGHLCHAHNARVALLGRRTFPARDEWGRLISAGDPSASALQHVLAMEEAGGEVLILQADVTSLEQMRNALNQVASAYGHIDGILHAAGLPGCGLLQNKSDDQAWSVLAPKVAGTFVLEQLMQEFGIELLVLCSSTASVLGAGPGQADYVAGNAFMDTYAALDHSFKSVAVNWGEWQWNAWDAGLQGFPAELRKFFIENRKAWGLTDEEGCAAFEKLLHMGHKQIIVCGKPLDQIVDDLDRVREMIWSGTSRRKESAQISSWQTTGAVQPSSTSSLERTLTEIWERLIGAKNIRIRDRFSDLGGTSLIGLQMVAEIKRLLGIDIPAAILYEAPTIEAMAKHIQGLLHGSQETTGNLPESTQNILAPLSGARRHVAIVGMSGRFPGSANVKEFWKSLVEGREGISYLSDDELIRNGVAPEKLSNPRYVKAVGSVQHIDKFDAQFFGYPPREAELLDPQHRVFLECAWEALEDAGEGCENGKDRVGVFGGANISTYMLSLLASPQLKDQFSPFSLAIANYGDSLATKVSYKLNLTGPSINVQTFCSTSAVATHLACRSLIDGDCDMALAGGVRIAVPQERGYLWEPGSIDSPDGHCRAFDKDGKGALLSNGVGVVALKRLEDAVADGNHIYAVIIGSSVNNDGGLKTGYTAPSVEGQSQAITNAIREANIAPESIQYLEAHGTATELGDPIEMAALNKAYRRFTQETQFCAIGSVKSNIGHTDRAAGVTSLIKTALALKSGVIPASLHFSEPNPEIDFANSPFFVNTQLRPWKNGPQPRRAAVNALGIGGTNAHFILQEAPVAAASTAARPWNLLLLSATSEAALNAMTENLAKYLEQEENVNLSDVAYTLQIGRRGFEHRRAVVCRDRADAIRALRGEDPQRLLTLKQEPSNKQLAFVLAGVGDHYLGMGAGLYGSEPAFRQCIDECCAWLKKEMGLDLLEALRQPPAAKAGRNNSALKRMLGGERDLGVLARTEAAQPAVFVLEYAMGRLLESWGVQPQGLIGYSLGEYVAATLAGVFTLEDALRLVATRARRIGSGSDGGGAAEPGRSGEVAGAGVVSRDQQRAEDECGIGAGGSDCRAGKEIAGSGGGEPEAGSEPCVPFSDDGTGSGAADGDDRGDEAGGTADTDHVELDGRVAEGGRSGVGGVLGPALAGDGAVWARSGATAEGEGAGAD